jgi:hypothetical protein
MLAHLHRTVIERSMDRRNLSLLCRHTQIYTTSLASWKVLVPIQDLAYGVIGYSAGGFKDRVCAKRTDASIHPDTIDLLRDDPTGRDLIGLLRNCSGSNCQKASPVQKYPSPMLLCTNRIRAHLVLKIKSDAVI